MDAQIQRVIDDIDRILLDSNQIGMDTVQAPRSRSRWDDEGDSDRVSYHQSTEDLARANAQLLAGIRRYAPNQSAYVTQADATLGKYGLAVDYARQQLRGILSALRSDYEHGAMSPVFEITRADLFQDFLAMAKHLLDKGFKDPAAVLASGVMEQHVRRLATKYGISLLNSEGKPRRTEALNEELSKTGAYEMSTQKEVTAKLGLRNHAAHGEWEKYDAREANLFIQWVAFFVEKNPA